ncbi:MAG: hypothetical protein V3S26_07680 [Acidimicrobiia bacterium]
MPAHGISSRRCSRLGWKVSQGAPDPTPGGKWICWRGLVDGSYTKWLLWILAGLFTLGALANIASKSKVERLLWGPIAFIIAVSIAMVAIGL